MSSPARNDEVEELKAELLGSFLLFVQTFFPLVTGKPFIISNPPGRESHFITIAKELTLVFRMQCNALSIQVPPGSGKSTLLSMFVAWTMAKFQNSQYLYISYSHELASKHTAFIKQIIECRQYKELFGIKVRSDSRAKDFFQTEQGASVKAFGSSGSITGQDAGLPHSEHFTGCVIMDDCHKPGEVHSDTVRQSVIQNYRETILQRPRAPNVAMIYIGQRLHEDDLPAYLLSGKDVRVWKPVVLKALDEAGNALYPEVNPLSQLLEQQEKNPYVFASQYQQNPIPAGGALFKPENFVLLDEEPEILLTFITADTAETNKSYNDATAFSFWGLYEIEEMGIKTGQTGLHSLDAVELRIEPKDLRAEFMSFYGDCMLHKVKPLIAAIEKKSTGVTLCSVLQDMRGLSIREVKRTKASGSKTDRYLEMQPIIASKLVSFTKGAKHTDTFINHMMKITANDTHRHDDLCDTMYDAIKLTLIDKTLNISQNQDGSHIVKSMAQEMNNRFAARTRAYGNQNGWLHR
jgi:predicted phage terminase large subunit-like protein